MNNLTFNDFNIGMTVYNINIDNGDKPLKVVGIRETQLEVQMGMHTNWLRIDAFRLEHPSVKLADSIIDALDLYARQIDRGSDRGSYGLPVFDHNEMNQMRSIITELIHLNSVSNGKIKND